MNEWFNAVDSWIVAACAGLLMALGWGFGYWRGSRLPEYEREKADPTFSGASMALLGLLLGFTFAMSQTKHEQRRAMVVDDSNAIGDFFTCACLVEEPTRGRLKKAIKDYAEHRLAVAVGGIRDRAEMEAYCDRAAAAHTTMQKLVGEAVDRGTPVVVPLVNTLNDVTSSHNSRVFAALDRLPPIIVVLLLAAAAITMILVGQIQGAGGQPRLSGSLAFFALVTLVVWVILDLNQPSRGLITVGQEPMERVLRGME